MNILVFSIPDTRTTLVATHIFNLGCLVISHYRQEIRIGKRLNVETLSNFIKRKHPRKGEKKKQGPI
jgi:hypothetical protein